jgi:hypothetical protein
MLGASQFVNVVVFQFSGPEIYLSAKPVLRSLFRDSATQVFALPALVALKSISTLHVEKLAHRLELAGAVP